MKKSLVIATISLLTIGSASVMASEVGTLNTFQAGQPAVADDVNENFNVIKTAVDNNDARITANEAAISANTAEIATKVDASDVTAAIATKADATAVDAISTVVATKADST